MVRTVFHAFGLMVRNALTASLERLARGIFLWRERFFDKNLAKPNFYQKKSLTPKKNTPRVPFERSEKQPAVRHNVLISRRILIVKKLGWFRIFAKILRGIIRENLRNRWLNFPPYLKISRNLSKKPLSSFSGFG